VKLEFSLEKVKNMKIRRILRNYELYIIILPSFLYFLIFNYFPMYGVQLAFKDYMANKGIMGSPWIGFTNFIEFFRSYYFFTLIKNTVGISLYELIAGFPFPIMLALMLNEVRNAKYKKLVQTVTYAPHFISTVVFVGMIFVFFNKSYGIVNTLLKLTGGKSRDWINIGRYFKSLYVWTGIWKSTGWGSIIYFAALSNIDQEQHEAAIIDGASRIQRVWHINIPAIIPIAIILLILSIGSVMSVGFEKVYLMQTPLNMEQSDVIATYVYRVGMLNAKYSFSTAVGLFNSAINCFLLILFNYVSRKLTATSLW
jgi:putative aldouronate transport system permease protein